MQGTFCPSPPRAILRKAAGNSIDHFMGERKDVRVRRREAGGESRMKESYKVRPSQSPCPRVMRVVGQPAGRSVHRGTTGLCMELRKHLSAVADLVLTRGRQ